MFPDVFQSSSGYGPMVGILQHRSADAGGDQSAAAE
jgi:hypothetical protein